jgi:hypothetical protein
VTEIARSFAAIQFVFERWTLICGDTFSDILQPFTFNRPVNGRFNCSTYPVTASMAVALMAYQFVRSLRGVRTDADVPLIFLACELVLTSTA